ncbi:hypothetical protein ACFX2C_004627 [Malus domestica]
MALHWRMHILHLSLVMVVVVTILLATPTPTTAQSLLPPQALPGCPDHCGNLTIPYQFGIGSDCYLDYRFNITCDISTQPPTTFFMEGNLKITNISLYDGELQVLQFAASDCYDAQGNSTGWTSPGLWVPPPYTISETKNVFVAVGCDTYAFFTGYRGAQKYTTGCMSICDDLGNAIDQRDTCSGVGCCQTKISSALQNQTPTDAATRSLCKKASSTLTARLKTRALLHARQIAPAIIVRQATYASAGQVTKGTHTSQMVAKILMSARLQTPAVWEPA